MRQIILVVSVLIASFSVNAQDSTSIRSDSKSARKAEKRQRINALSKQEEEGNLVFTRQNAFGIQLRTNGYGLFYELGQRRTPRFTNLYSIEITEIKHRKEEKITPLGSFFNNSFVYGKRYNFYQGKLGIGQQYILGQKGNKNGVAVTASVNTGVSIGVLKSYILQVEDNRRSRSVSYSEDSTLFLDESAIIGGGGFTKGWDEVKIKPGAFLKGALRFDFGRYNERVQALEIGLGIEGYAQKIPIMVYNEPRRLFFQGHIAFVFGGRK